MLQKQKCFILIVDQTTKTCSKWWFHAWAF